MTRTCPWCLERLAARPRAEGGTCPWCGRPLEGDAGRELRSVDVRWKGVEAELWSRTRVVVVGGVPIVALVVLLAPPLTAPAVAAVLAATQLLILRLVVTAPVQRLLGARRRLLNRWVSRLLVLWVALPGYGAAVLPVAGAVVAAGAFAGVSLACSGYAGRSLRRERDRAAPPPWETVLVVGLGVLTVAVLAAVVVVVVAVGWTVSEILARLL